MSITYDSTELVSATYIPRFAKHETVAERLINSLKLARQDGEIIIDDTYSVKYIDIEGILVGSSQSDLETKIDAFKELISRKDKNLDISWAGGTRRYVCRAVAHEFDRDHYHLMHVPYKVRFFVPLGYGKNTSETTSLNKSGITATTDTEAITFEGSYQPKPRHKVTITTRGNADVIRIENTDTGDYIDVDLDGFSDTDYLEIDEENQTVKKNGTTNLDYRGKFPSVIIGANNLKLTVLGSGSTLDQEQTNNDGSGTAIFVNGGWNSSPWQAQSFIPSQSGRIHKLNVSVAKDDGGALDGPMQFLIYSNDNGKPGSPIYVGNEYEITHANVQAAETNTDAVWDGTDANRPFLKKGQRYWIVLNPGVISGSNSTNFYRWTFSNLATRYLYGKAMFRKSNADPWQDGYADASNAAGGTVEQDDMKFKVYRGVDGGAASHSVVWQIYYTKKYI
ncbi:MAG: hypothetical protein WC737_05760 [Parcubacteria group bacterium]|jgi:hypothetical protein